MSGERFFEVRVNSGNKQIDKVVLPKGTKFSCKVQCLSCKSKGINQVEILNDVFFGDGDDKKRLQFVCPKCDEVSIYEIGSRYLKTWFYVGDKFALKPKCTEEEAEYLKKLISDKKGKEILNKLLEQK